MNKFQIKIHNIIYTNCIKTVFTYFYYNLHTFTYIDMITVVAYYVYTHQSIY